MNPRRCQTEDNASVKAFAEKRPNNTRIRTCVWGSDLSVSVQGAGGVGGLLEVSYYGSAATNCFPAFDGNGNVAALINAADGTVAANDECAAFGEPVRVTGAWPGTIRSGSQPNTLTTNPICFTMATAITSRHCAGKFQSCLQTRAGVEVQSARIRFNQPRETRFKLHENCKINHRCSVCAAHGTNRFCLLLPVNWALAVA
jgi:hypothetical protein